MRILVAENDAVIRHVLRRALSPHGHNIIEASDGEQAWQVLQSSPELCVAILDRELPHRSALDICRLVRQSGRPVYIMIIASRWDRAEFMAAKAAGADDYLVEPLETIGIFAERVKLGVTEMERRRCGELPKAALEQGMTTILLLEDEDIVRRFVETVLGAAGFRVFATGTAEEATAVAKAYRGDIALFVTDHLLPQGKTGVELAAMFRQWRPNLKVLHMSGLPEHELAAHKHGIDDGFFIGKPFLPRELITIVGRILGRRS